MSRYFVVVVGREQGARWRLPDGRTVVGRGPECGIVLDEDQVSRVHAAFFVEDRFVTIDDLGSTNGTQVNAVRVLRAVLGVGDRVQIGRVLLELRETPEGRDASIP